METTLPETETLPRPTGRIEGIGAFHDPPRTTTGCDASGRRRHQRPQSRGATMDVAATAVAIAPDRRSGAEKDVVVGFSPSRVASWKC